MANRLIKRYEALALDNSVEPKIIGSDMKEADTTAITQQRREDIAVSLGVPLSLLYSNAANYATAQQDAANFYTHTVIPEIAAIASSINRQLLTPLGLTLTPQPSRIEALQYALLEQAKAVNEAVGATENTVMQVRDGKDAIEGTARQLDDLFKVINNTDAGIQETIRSIEKSDANIQNIAINIERINAVIQQSSGASEQLSSSTEEIASTLEEMSAGAEELNAAADRLFSEVKKI